MHQLTTIVRELASENVLVDGILRLQRAICRQLHVTDALCVWMDWPRRIAWTISGRLSEQTEELVAQVAGSGRREIVGSALVEPIGLVPTRAVLALRKPTGGVFAPDELAMIATFSAGIAPALERLIAHGR